MDPTNPYNDDEDEPVLDLGYLYSEENNPLMHELLMDPDVTQIIVNSYDKIFYDNSSGPKTVRESVFPSAEVYIKWLNGLLAKTNAPFSDVDNAPTPIIEGSFKQEYSGSIHICTKEITVTGQPVLTVRKQPVRFVSLEDMLSHNILSQQMFTALQLLSFGRVNMLISGGTGSGKTTLARALARYVDPTNHLVTCEEVEELNLDKVLQNVVPLATSMLRDPVTGVPLRETTLEDLVNATLRMRADRIWVGEVRGKEASALLQAALSGSAGCITTIHANSGEEAIEKLVSYAQMAGIPTTVAREMVSRAFQIIVHVEKIRPGERKITDIVEQIPVVETTKSTRQSLFRWDHNSEIFERRNNPSPNLIRALRKYGISWDMLPPPAAPLNSSRR